MDILQMPIGSFLWRLRTKGCNAVLKEILGRCALNAVQGRSILL